MLTVAFNNSERAFGKNRIKEPWDYPHIFEIAVFAVLIVPLAMHFAKIPEDREIRNMLCNINYLIFSGAAVYAVKMLGDKGCFAQRIRLSVLLAALAMPVLVFKTVLDILSAAGVIKSFGAALENSAVIFLVGIVPLAATAAFYIAIKKKYLTNAEKGE